ncbi:MAG: hypothetical protein A2Y00_00835 [Omnitrophica WOR_2 bacterium GWF2_43_52]|nr:MAG: hypothetical protein A2062_07330 [Omnitrophica WOR_2 bacterium GWA2_44_7]OGX18198.1 MAG: hypothetical protein A2Y01_04220 [Omnitrophica WOR_2 bacterium GWC2_44_8]OGX21007.1 MAG: hypothetical protein A2Y00_00835 [Omnitrophica WOR_2 bacterium GWF2_43_52]OGX58363.1 MAG: hypothetical protein A2460_08130 [Omnitrophica WOR_2 bacterium RIFOXYC2_FULL_43_9]HAH21186.1 hypothetical protein [Candidatus Omnitrophota bacterium]
MYEVAVGYQSSSKYKVTSLGYEVAVDFPKPDGSIDGITPPALFLASLGSCLAVYLERYLRGAKIKFDNFSINVKSDICKESPRYLKTIDVIIELKGADIDSRRKEALLEFVKNCPVHNTLTQAPTVNVSL